MSLYRLSDQWAPYLIYDAPVDEKTKQIRKMFKVDETTGYPEHYNWRPMARLGREYSYTDPFEKLGRSDPDQYISTDVTAFFLTTASASALHYWVNFRSGKKFYAGLPRLIGLTAATLAFMRWAREKTIQHNAKKNHILVDYVRKHPDRFEKIPRPKHRELLFEFVPIR